MQLYVLGRRLMKLGEGAMSGTGFARLPSSVRTVLLDVSEHPGSSISEIVGRTGFPQSLVSAAVARLRDGGALMTAPDPADRRRTLVHVSAEVPARAARARIDPAEPVIAAALGIDDRAELKRVVSTLSDLGERLAAAERITATH
jgi:DNA-binding MarR family transcriptional regulator